MRRYFSLGIVVLVILGFMAGGYYALHIPGLSVFGNLALVTGASDEVITPTSGREVPAGAREYYNQHYHFSILYPQDLKVKEREEGQGAITITLEDDTTLQGFQIFIVPYKKPQVSEDRFKKDLPSGVRTGLSNITIDGGIGAAFYSKDRNLGDTREVWFISPDAADYNPPYLYEVTTVKSLDTWLEDILQTWKFF